MTEDSFVSTHRREATDETAVIAQANAFQALGKYTLPEVLTREGLNLHLVWNRTAPPMSAWISVFNNEGIYHHVSLTE